MTLVLPSTQRALEIIQLLAEKNALGIAIKRSLVVDEKGVVNIPRVAYDTKILRLAAARAYFEIGNSEIDKVLTAAVNGLPLAAFIADALDIDLCVARQEVEPGIDNYIEAKYFAPDPPRYTRLYLPSFMLGNSDRIIVVDDLLRTGRTLKALYELASAKGASVEAVLSLVAVGEEWRRAVPEGTKVIIGIEVKKSS
ncbi:MAG: phosphoribosyltransferase family protein [Thermofilaceae archaeon]